MLCSGRTYDANGGLIVSGFVEWNSDDDMKTLFLSDPETMQSPLTAIRPLLASIIFVRPSLPSAALAKGQCRLRKMVTIAQHRVFTYGGCAQIA